MRYFILIILIFLMTTSVVFADDGSSGCGLGWRVTSRMSLSASSTRSTTNGFLPNSYSMTTGTSGCGQHMIVKNEEPALIYASTNKDALILDMAQGQGVYLIAFAQTLGCPAADMLGKATKTHFSEILKNSNRSDIDFFLEIKKAMHLQLLNCEVIGS